MVQVSSVDMAKHIKYVTNVTVRSIAYKTASWKATITRSTVQLWATEGAAEGDFWRGRFIGQRWWVIRRPVCLLLDADSSERVCQSKT